MAPAQHALLVGAVDAVLLAVADEEPADAGAAVAALERARVTARPLGAAPGAVRHHATRAVAHPVDTARVAVRHLALDVPGAGQPQRDRSEAEAVRGLVAVGFHGRGRCKFRLCIENGCEKMRAG